MSNLYDFVDWRGDLSFGNVPLGPVDALILSMLSYLDFADIVPADVRGEPLRLADVAKKYLARPAVPKRKVFGLEDCENLLHVLAKCERFGSLRVLGAQKNVDHASGLQFGAVSYLLSGQNIFVAFEGTDDTIVGWKENFRMSYECPIPAQLKALAYLREVAAAYPMRRIYVGGHSKGGNLAMFAAVNAGEGIRARIRAVYNNDGPGFCDDTLQSPAYLEMHSRIYTYLPQSSIVGVLLEHDTNYKIVRSARRGLLQHDAFSWEVLGNDFVYATERTAFGTKTEAIVDRFMDMISPARKRQFCEALFGILEASERDTFSGILLNKRQSLKGILGAYADLPDDVKLLLIETLGALNDARREVKRENRIGRSVSVKDKEG